MHIHYRCRYAPPRQKEQSAERILFIFTDPPFLPKEHSAQKAVWQKSAQTVGMIQAVRSTW